MEPQRLWHLLPPQDRAALLADIAYSLTTGDDHLIHISNAARDEAEARGVSSEALEAILMAASKAAI